jgi:hypothetical protein
VRSTGYKKRYVPKQVGRIADGHNLLRGGPWDETFEPLYDRPDNDFGKLVHWLSGLHRKPVEKRHRAHAPVFPDSIRAMLARCLASLIVRNPTMRDSIKRTVSSYQEQMGFVKPDVSKNLIGANIQHLYLEFANQIESSGKFAFLYAPSGMEFIFGDGFLHNFPNVKMRAPNRFCVIPLSPEVTVFWFSPTSAWVRPKAVTIPLTVEEAEFCNRTVQVYSKEFIYFRAFEPLLEESFGRGEHLIYEYDERPHANPILDKLMAEISQYRLLEGRMIG